MFDYGLTTGEIVKHNQNGKTRLDRSTAKSDGHVCYEHVLTVSRLDRSPQYNGKYDPKCSGCWLGYPHTIEKHNQSISE